MTNERVHSDAPKVAALDRNHLRGEPTGLSITGTAARGSRGKSGNPMGRRLLIYLNGRLK